MKRILVTLAAVLAALSFTAGGSAAILVGTPENDQIAGTSQDDLIRGLRGNDTIQCNGGNDAVHGAGGGDRIKCGTSGAYVTVFGGPGYDYCTVGVNAYTRGCEVLNVVDG